MKSIFYKYVIAILLCLFVKQIYAQSWPAIPRQSETCFLIGNFKGVAMREFSGLEAYYGDALDQTSWQPILNNGSNSWATDVNGVICLGQLIDFNYGQLIITYEESIGVLYDGKKPVIKLEEALNIDLYGTNIKEDDFINRDGDLIDVSIRARKDQLLTGPINLKIRCLNSQGLRFSEKLNSKGMPENPQDELFLTITNDLPIVFYAQSVPSFSYSFASNSHDTIWYTVTEIDSIGNPVTELGNDWVIVSDNPVMYRGVGNTSVLFPDAINGRIYPKYWGKSNAVAKPEDHTRGQTNSIFISWSLSQMVGGAFATGKTGEGVLLKREFLKSEITKTNNDRMPYEQEILAIGPVTQGIFGRSIDKNTYGVDFQSAMHEAVNDNLDRSEVLDRLNSLEQGTDWPSMPDAAPCFILADNFGITIPGKNGIKAYLEVGGSNTPILNQSGLNEWSTNENGEICFDLGGPLNDGEQIRIELPGDAGVVEGIAKNNFPIAYLKTNPNSIVLKKILPHLGIESIKVGQGQVIQAKVTQAKLDIDGNPITNTLTDAEIKSLIQSVSFFIGTDEIPLWQGVSDLQKNAMLGKNVYRTIWTPSQEGFFKLTGQVELVSGEVIPMTGKVTFDVSGSSIAQNHINLNITQEPSGSSLTMNVELSPTGSITGAHHYTSALTYPEEVGFTSNQIVVDLESLSDQGSFFVDIESGSSLIYDYNYLSQANTGQILSVGDYSFRSGSTYNDLTLLYQRSSPNLSGLPETAQMIYMPVYFASTNNGEQNGGSHLNALLNAFAPEEPAYLDAPMRNSLKWYKWDGGQNQWTLFSSVSDVSGGVATIEVTGPGAYVLVSESATVTDDYFVTLEAPQTSTISGIELRASTETYSGNTPDTVEFYSNGLLIGKSYSSTSQFTKFWTPPSVGYYIIEAVAKRGSERSVSDQISLYVTEFGCPELNSEISETFINSGTYNSGEVISTNGTVEVQGIVSIHAGADVTLNPGFSAPAGVDLDVFIASCDGIRQLNSRQGEIADFEHSGMVIENTLTKNASPISIYPNPFTHDVHLKISYDEWKSCDINVYNQLGEKVWSESVGNHSDKGVITLQVPQQLPIGLYTLVVTINESDFHSLKLLKQ